MTDCLLPNDHAGATRPVSLVAPETLAAVLADLPGLAQGFARANAFDGKAGSFVLLPGADGSVAGALFGIGSSADPVHNPLLAGRLPALLPEGDWRFEGPVAEPALAALGFAMGSYRFNRYSGAAAKAVRLVVGAGVDLAGVAAQVDAIVLGRDMINTPANDMGPAEIAAVARAEAERVGASVREIVGDELLAANFPLIHAVGKGSARAPRIVEFSWGEPSHPKVTLVGKGVAFDTGGLDIKPSSGMILMKKDMGGAASILALARMIVDAKLPVRLRVIIPTVENSVSGRAMRPSDVYPSRKGPTVEIGNTDAEGRLILADALALADEEAPDLLVDFATLTGAARVALGPDLPPFYTHDDELAAEIQKTAHAVADPLWRLPLWLPYGGWIDSKIADVSNNSSAPFAGSITAALFLDRFVVNARSWVHVDIYGWNPAAKPGRPEGGEVQAARALFEVIRARYV